MRTFRGLSTQLESPSLRLKDSYLSHVEEFRQRGEWPIPFVLKYPTDDFPAFLRRLEQCAQGAEIANGFVAHSTFWLVEDGQHVVGVSSLRHSLNDNLRRDGGNIGYGIRPTARRRGFATLILWETLLKAKGLGLTRALVTAEKGNIGSIKTILKNGGVFDSEELLPGYNDVMQRFWIPVY
jgi:predicted acetyltransferase